MYYPKTVQFRGSKLYSFAMRDCTVSHSETYKFFMVKLLSFILLAFCYIIVVLKIRTDGLSVEANVGVVPRMWHIPINLFFITSFRGILRSAVHSFNLFIFLEMFISYMFFTYVFYRKSFNASFIVFIFKLNTNEFAS